MKKIWVLASIILLFVLLLGAWIIVVEFGGFANFLGEKSSDIQDTSKFDFVGTWKTDNLSNNELLIGVGGTYYFSSTGTGTFGGIGGQWKKLDNNLVINYEENEIKYDFSFSEDKNTLILSNKNGNLIFTKK